MKTRTHAAFHHAEFLRQLERILVAHSAGERAGGEKGLRKGYDGKIGRKAKEEREGGERKERLKKRVRRKHKRKEIDGWRRGRRDIYESGMKEEEWKEGKRRGGRMRKEI